MYLGFKFRYAVIKITEKWTEETEELSESLFDSGESEIMKREIDCKGVTYHECNDYDERNDHDKCDE